MILRIARYIDIYIGIPLLYLCYWTKKAFWRGSVCNTPDGYKKILLIKFWGIGNAAMLLPSALALKAKYENAEFDFLTLPNSKEILKAAKIFDNIYTMEYKNIIKFISATISNFRILRNKDYDLMIDFEQFARLSSLFCLFTGRKKTIGFNTRGQHRHFVYTSSVLYDNSIHMTRSFYSLLEPMGIGKAPEIKLPSITCEKSDVSDV